MTVKEFLDRVGERSGIADRDRNRKLTEAVMDTLCGRISLGEVEDMAEELPGVISRMCKLERTDMAQLGGDVEAFLYRVRNLTNEDAPSAEQATRAVFNVLKEQLSDREVSDVADQLPIKLKAVWLGS